MPLPMLRFALLARLLHALAIPASTALGAEDDGFVSLFNNHDLNGWVNVNCAPETWSVREGRIYCTGQPIGALRTPRQYENFILELEWRHLEIGGNSGVFIWSSPIAAPGVPFLRGIEVQVLDHGFNVPGKNQWYTTHGDVFPIHGASMKPFGRHNGERSFPSEERSKGSPEWNHYRIVCTNGVLRLHVNGKEVSGGEQCNYRKGYIGLESEGAPVEFRNLRIKELPPGGAPSDLSAPQDLGWRSIFTGLDLRGWKTNASTTLRWQAGDSHISLKEGVPNDHATLWTENSFGNGEFVVDCRPAKGSANSQSAPAVRVRGLEGIEGEVKLVGGKPGEFQRFFITIKEHVVTVKSGEKVLQRIKLDSKSAARGSFGLSDTGSGVEFMNLYARDL